MEGNPTTTQCRNILWYTRIIISEISCFTMRKCIFAGKWARLKINGKALGVGNAYRRLALDFSQEYSAGRTLSAPGIFQVGNRSLWADYGFIWSALFFDYWETLRLSQYRRPTVRRRAKHFSCSHYDTNKNVSKKARKKMKRTKKLNQHHAQSRHWQQSF